MRSIQATHNLLAVSALLKETALNTEQTLDTGMLVDVSQIFKLGRRRESNADEAIGKEEPDALYDLGALSSMEMAFTKGQAQHAAFLLAYALGQVSTAAAGATGYRHTITPIVGDLDASRSNPSFTGGMRYGKWLLKRRFGGCLIDAVTLTLARDSWMKVSGSIKGTGKQSTNMNDETVNAAYNAASLTLAANGVAGSTAQERLDNVHHIQVQVPTTGEWVDVVYSAVSDASPAIITITPPGGVATLVDYVIVYNIKEAGSYAWCSFPSRVSEPPLRVSDFLVNIGGKWDGSAIAGGHQLSSDINSLEWSFSQGLAPEFTPGSGSGVYANRALREGRTQKIILDRKFRDYIIGQRHDDNETFVIYAKAEGAEYESGHKYTVEIVWPKVGVMDRDVSVGGKRLDEKTDLIIMEDDTYGSVIAYVKNKVATYAA